MGTGPGRASLALPSIGPGEEGVRPRSPCLRPQPRAGHGVSHNDEKVNSLLVFRIKLGWQALDKGPTAKRGVSGEAGPERLKIKD